VRYVPLAAGALRLPLVLLSTPEPSPRAREFVALATRRSSIVGSP